MAGRPDDRSATVRSSHRRLRRRGPGDSRWCPALLADTAAATASMGGLVHHVGRVARAPADDRRRASADENAAQVLTQDLREVARRVMIEERFDPDPDPAIRLDLQSVCTRPDDGAPLKDPRNPLWPTTDNDAPHDHDR